MLMDISQHKAVLLQEVIEYLVPLSLGRYVDCTLGAGGHAERILEATLPDGLLLGLDVDEQALCLAQTRLETYKDRIIIKRESYTQLGAILESIFWQEVDGILMDLGVSSMQLDHAERGFSFRQEAELDMRFDTRNTLTASIIVNQYAEKELADLIYHFGEEQRSRHVAHNIVKNRPIRTTLQLAHLVDQVTKSGKPGIHAATRTFQALRIAVNRELEAIEALLPQALQALRIGGRIVVISFHSLEDRIVKQYFQREGKDCLCPPQQPICTCGHKARLKWVTRHVVTASDLERKNNPRARSARLRVVEKVA